VIQRSLFLELLKQQLLTALIPIVCIGGVAALVIFPKMLDELEINQRSIALSVSDQVASHLHSANEHLKLIAMDIVANPNAAQLSNRLDGFVQVSDVFSTVYVTSPNGKIGHIGLPINKVATRRLFIDMDISFSTLWIENLNPGESSWSNIFISPITGRQSVALQTQIGRSNLIAEVDILRMPTLTKQLSKDGMMVMLLDEKANLVAHPDPDISQQQFNMGYASLFTENTKMTRTGSFLWDSTEYYATVVPLPETRWQVVISKPLPLFYSTISYLTNIWLIMAFLTILITSFIAYRSARAQSRPFQQLQSIAGKISSGQYDVEALSSSIVEFQEVSNTFVRMAERVRSREGELTDLNAKLESRVELRTSELLEINDELTKSVLRLETTMEQLVQSEKLASLGSLVAGIAHELNTPIGNAKIAVSSQQDYLRDIQNDLENNTLKKSSLNQFVEDITSTADMGFRNMERATELIRSFKQVAVDQTSSQQRLFSLSTMINEVLVTLRPTLKKHPVHVDTRVPANIEMNSLPGPLSQILTNLINNAIFHGLGKKANIEIHIEAECVNDQVHLIFQDTGIGMSESDQKRAFDPFFTTKMGQGGSGLGLNIVHRMVKGMLKGDIILDSTEGAGTTFRLILPINLTEPISNKTA